MKNKTIANWLAGSNLAAAYAGLAGLSEGTVTFIGFVMIVAAVMVTVRLYKLEDK